MSTNSKLLAEMQADITALLGVKTLSAEHEAKLRQILSWPHWDDIQTGAQKEYHMSAKQFRSVVIEYWKFMGLIACGYSGLGMFSRDVDKIWHSHILNMPLYQDFCVSVLGYIAQHIPNLKKGKREMSTCCTGSIHCKPGQAALLTCNNPRCVTKCRTDSNMYDPSRRSQNPLQYFRFAYFSVYGTLPTSIWGLKAADGRCGTTNLSCKDEGHCECGNCEDCKEPASVPPQELTRRIHAEIQECNQKCRIDECRACDTQCGATGKMLRRRSMISAPIMMHQDCEVRCSNPCKQGCTTSCTGGGHCLNGCEAGPRAPITMVWATFVNRYPKLN